MTGSKSAMAKTAAHIYRLAAIPDIFAGFQREDFHEQFNRLVREVKSTLRSEVDLHVIKLYCLNFKNGAFLRAKAPPLIHFQVSPKNIS